MRDFLKYLLASILGVMLAFLLIFFVVGGAIGVALQGEKAKMDSNSVLQLSLNYPIPEKTQEGLEGFNPIDPDFSIAPGLNDILASIRKAGDDDKIKGIWLELGFNPNAYGTLQEIRDELDAFKAKGKFVVGYGQMVGQSSYWLGSVSDEIYMHPTGLLDFKGFNAEIAFYKEALDKLGVKMEVFYDGRFKSATEPFRFTQMSEENRLQIREFIDDAYGHYINTIAESRGLSKETLLGAADQLKAYNIENALKLGMVDQLLYRDEANDAVKEKCGLNSDDKLPLVKLSEYRKTLPEASGDANIAVIYAEGGIVDGAGSGSNIGGATMSNVVRKARKDDDIRAIVLRVNSPGGSAFASDEIWREVSLAAKEKTVVVSMGDYAASGGYFIACPADYIFAQPNTLTGSIGVFLLFPYLQELMEEKIGITSDREGTGSYADFPNPNRPLTDYERQVLQAGVDSTYVDFKRKVAAGRDGLDMAAVEEVAQGRIWTGVAALNNGLIDEIGGLDEAIAKAAEMEGIDKPRIKEMPEADLSPWEELVVGMTEETRSALLQSEFGTLYNSEIMEHLRQLNELQGYDRMQMRLPFEIQLD